MNELIRLSISKCIISFLPQKGRTRFAKLLYNYASKKIKGIDLVIKYTTNFNLKILINTKEFSGWNIFFFGYYEKETNKILNNYIDKDDTVIEAGSHNGSESLIIGNIVNKGNGKLYAFEPEPSIFNKLKINIALNEFENIIRPVNLALGEQNNEVNFFLMPADAANQGMSSKYPYQEAGRNIKVKQVTLDHWVQENNIPHINFIKMDVQGSELDLIKGGLATIKNFKPVILTEAEIKELNMGGNTLKNLWLILNELGYSIYNISVKLKLKDVNNLSPGIWLAVDTDKESTFNHSYE